MQDDPTWFPSNKDRAVYLLGEYRIPLTAMLLAGAALWAYYDPSLPTPPDWVPSFAAAVFILSVPSYFAGLKIAKWLRKRNWIKVLELDARREVAQPHLVPPKVWAEKEIVEGAPYRPSDESEVIVVQRFDWHEDVGRLEVAGPWMANATDLEMWTEKQRIEQIFGWLQDAAKERNQYRAVGSVMGLDVQEATVNDLARAIEHGTMMDKSAVDGAISRAMDSFESDQNEPPSMHDLEDTPDELEDAHLPEDTNLAANGETHD